MKHILLYPIFFFSIIFADADNKSKDDKPHYFLSDAENINGLALEKKNSVLKELQSIVDAFNSELNKILLKDTVYVSTGSYVDKDEANELFLVSGLTVREARLLATKGTGKYVEVNRKCTFDETLLDKSPEWQAVLDFYGGYAGLTKTKITKDNYKGRLGLRLILNSIELTGRNSCLAHVELETSDEGKRFYGIENNELKFEGKTIIKELDYTDLYLEKLHPEKIDDAYVPALTFEFTPTGYLPVVEKSIYLSQLDDNKGHVKNAINSHVPILFTIINDMITNDEYLASKQGITLGDLSDERNLIVARDDFQLRVLDNSLKLYPVLLTFHVIAREKGYFFKEKIRSFTDFLTPMDHKELPPNPDVWPYMPRYGKDRDSGKVEITLSRKATIEDWLKEGRFGNGRKKFVIWESAYGRDFFPGFDWEAAVEKKQGHDDIQDVDWKKWKSALEAIINEKRYSLLEEFYPYTSKLEQLRIELDEYVNSPVVQNAFNADTPYSFDDLNQAIDGYKVLEQRLYDETDALIKKLKNEYKVPVHDPFIFYRWMNKKGSSSDSDRGGGYYGGKGYMRNDYYSADVNRIDAEKKSGSDRYKVYWEDLNKKEKIRLYKKLQYWIFHNIWTKPWLIRFNDYTKYKKYEYQELDFPGIQIEFENQIKYLKEEFAADKLSTPEEVQKMKEYLSNVDYKVHKEIIINLLTNQPKGVKDLEVKIVAEYEKILDDGGYSKEAAKKIKKGKKWKVTSQLDFNGDGKGDDKGWYEENPTTLFDHCVNLEFNFKFLKKYSRRTQQQEEHSIIISEILQKMESEELIRYKDRRLVKVENALLRKTAELAGIDPNSLTYNTTGRKYFLNE